MSIVKVQCGWCMEFFKLDNSRNPRVDSYGTKVCTNCGRVVPSSKKEPTGNVIGRKHFHSAWKTGDVVQ